jgi:sugar phosphate isomerase/epimerase
MTANYVARQVGYNMTEGWGQGDGATNEYFKPIETYADRLGEYLRDVRAMGFDALDLWLPLLNYTWATDAHVQTAADLLKQHGLQVVSLAGWFGATPEDFEKVCEMATALDCTILGGGTSMVTKDRPFVIDTLHKYGVRWGFENHPEKTPQEVLDKIGDDGDGVIGVAIDTGWFGTQGYDAARAIEELGDRLFHVHLKDVRSAGAHDTCRFGEGVVPIEACVQTLKRLGYNGAVCIEHEPEHSDPTEDVKASLAMLQGWLS